MAELGCVVDETDDAVVEALKPTNGENVFPNFGTPERVKALLFAAVVAAAALLNRAGK